jgi:hypothetical protein
MVPLRLLRTIGAEETAPGWLITITGERHMVALYFVDVQLGKSVAPGLRVIADEEGQDIVLGRDFLNRFPIFLDGPQGQVTALDDVSSDWLRARSA